MAISKEVMAVSMMTLAEAFGTTLKQERITVYYEHLKGFDPEIFVKVLDWMLTEGERFPLISDFHRIARTKFKREINGDYTIRHD